MKNKRVLVTGASSGIGASTAEEFLLQGAKVGLHFNKNRTGAYAIQKKFSERQCRLFQADFTKTDKVLSLWKNFVDWAGGIDVLVNNAGEINPMPLEELTEEVWDSSFQVNTKAPFLLSKKAFEYMKKNGSGRIINISSIGVKFGGSITTIHYSASKAALEAITRSFAKAGAQYNILVNAVQVGVTDTPLHKKIGRSDLSERISLIPLKRLAQPKEIARVILFLAAEDNSFITGTVICVSGGE